jgi:rhodanese-related sulfurtransferase
VEPLSVHELHETSLSDSRVLVDVRSRSEYDAFHIEGSINIPTPELRTRYAELDPGIETVLICNTGRRSSLGASILLRQGFTKVHNVPGGTTGYSAAGFGPECPMCVVPHGPRFLGTTPG